MYFSWDLNVPTKDELFFHLCNHSNTKLSLFYCYLNAPERMLVSVIFVIISKMNCPFQLELECPSKGCKVLSSLKSF